MSVHKKIVSLAFATTLAGAGLIGSASTAGAASCYGSAHSYNKPANSSFLPQHRKWSPQVDQQLRGYQHQAECPPLRQSVLRSFER
jgi:hypothetical protein